MMEIVRPENQALGRWQVPCPKCSSEVIDRRTRDGVEDDHGDHLAVSTYRDRDKSESPIGTRGGWTSIALSCQYGHDFALVIANHKGAELMGIVPADKCEAAAMGSVEYVAGAADEPTDVAQGGDAERDELEMLSVSQVSALLGVSVNTLHRWSAMGHGPKWYHLGPSDTITGTRSLRCLRRELREWIESGAR